MDAVLIDDDVLIRMAWKRSARAAGKNLAVFAGPEEFLKAQGEIERSIPIFVDSDLSDGVRGEDFAKELFERGFQRIYLTTGFDPVKFGPMPWISGIIGKEPDWGLVG